MLVRPPISTSSVPPVPYTVLFRAIRVRRGEILEDTLSLHGLLINAVVNPVTVSGIEQRGQGGVSGVVVEASASARLVADALQQRTFDLEVARDRKSTRLNSSH